MLDAHAHLDFEVFDGDRDAVLQRARDVGVRDFVVPGVGRDQWKAARALGLPFCVGVHPEWLAQETASVETIAAALSDEAGIVGIGETGLDARIDVPMDRQREVFETHLRVAAARDLPVVLHVVRRHGAALDLLASHAPIRGMVHGFSGPPEIAERYAALGLHVSFGGIVTRERAAKARAAVRVVPSELLLVETDCPDMTPEGADAERNEPAFLPLVVAAVAALRGEPSSTVAERTEMNARSLFGLGC